MTFSPPVPRIKFRWRHLGQPYSFNCNAPYTEGHILTKAEAQALNILRSENIQNNLRQAFANEAGSCVDNVLSYDAITRIQAIVDKYDETYEFVEAHEPKPKIGALDREARDIAIGQLPDGASEAEIELLASTIDVIEEARQRLETQRKIANETLEDLLK